MDLLLDGRRALLEGLVDYAGVFPPASLSLDDAVAGYRDARRSPHAWILGRFLCRTSQIEELASLLTASMTSGEKPWSVGAVFDEAPGVAALHSGVFDRYMDPAARVTSVEVRAPEEASDGRDADAAAAVIRPVLDAASSVSGGATPFIEIARTQSWANGVRAAIAALGRLRIDVVRTVGAKLRTGGLSPEDFPSIEQVATFIVESVAAGVPFKATAGLHHALRHHDADVGVMRHGFLNLLVATAVAVEDGDGSVDTATVVAALAETDAVAFTVGPTGLRWRDRRLSAATLRMVRTGHLQAYGSCSFTEPVEDLVAIGVLGTDA